MSELTPQETVVYEWVAAGENSCERCAALNGSRWQQPPSPPHAHCECEVDVHQKFPRTPRDCGDTRWNVEQIPSGAVDYGSGEDTGFEWGYRVTIDCWDGGVFEFEIWVDMGKLSDWPITDTVESDLEGFAWSQIYDDAEAIAAQACRPCAPPLVS